MKPGDKVRYKKYMTNSQWVLKREYNGVVLKPPTRGGRVRIEYDKEGTLVRTSVLLENLEVRDEAT